MSIDWRVFSQEAGFALEERSVTVDLSEGRRQKVYVEDNREDRYLRIWSVAASALAMGTTSDLPELFAWRRNHLSDLVGFKIDRKQRLIGEA